jgi:hemolysin activation/secretion protein
VAKFGSILRLSLAAFLAAPAFVFAQAPEKPAADDTPRFEIRRFVFDGATLISPAQLEAATRQYTGPKRAFSDVQRVLETVERAYSDAGWSAVQVVLPEQELQRGEIHFQIIEAKIGRVIVEGNKFFDEANIRASAPSLEAGKAPNITEISRNLRVANESPAKQATVLLRSGQEEATVDAVLRVVDENPSKYSVTIDNTGGSQTGRLRTGFGYQNANANGGDEVLTLQFVTAPYSHHISADGAVDHLSLDPSGRVMIFGAGYRIPLYAHGDALDFSVGYSNINTGTVAGLFSITGRGAIFGARYTRNLDKIGDYEHRMTLSFDWRSYENSGVRPATGEPVQLVPDVVVHPITLLYSGVYRQQDAETAVSFGYTKNFAGGNDGLRKDFCLSRNNGLGMCADAFYEIWRYSFSHNRALPGDFQARASFNGQWSNDMLVSGEQFGIGGMDSVRGFAEREIVNDVGYRGTTEIYSPDFGSKLPFAGARTRMLLFVDWGHVARNRPGVVEQRYQDVWTYGLGLRFSRGTNMAFRVDYAAVAQPGGSQSVGDLRLHMSFSYIF